jgi:hypothetical protein
VQDSLTIML